ncbi:MAG: hypothetical protein IT453_04345 [Planctomycetes bacterium]|nr:hypothetical protein [Planctomycetota bacterium]
MLHPLDTDRFQARLRAAGALALLAAFASPGFAQQCSPDPFEPNDSCAALATVALGSHSGLTLEPGGADFYRVLVPAAQRLEVRVHLAVADPSLFGLFRLWRDDGSAVPCDATGAALAFELIELGATDFLLAWSSDTAAATSFVVGLESFGTNCADYALDLVAFPDPCAQLAADAFEPNDSCSAPAALGVGVFPGLTVAVGDLDFYTVAVAPSSLVTLDVTGLPAGDVLEVFAWSNAAQCGLQDPIEAGNVIYGPGAGKVFLANGTTAAKTYFVRVAPRPEQSLQTGFCTSYTLSVSSDHDPCGVFSGDAFEPNSDCSSAPLLASSQSGLSISQALDLDWYSMVVPPSSTLRIVSASTQPNVQRPLQLHSGCSGNPSFLTSSHPIYFDADARHLLQWTNTTSTPFDTRLLVIRPVGDLFCDVYDLDVGFTLGTPFCLAPKNSTGDAARLSASGSTTPGVGTLTLSAGPVPAGKSGLVIMSLSEKPATPFGKGYLCLGAPIVRFPVTSTGSGTLVTTLDWTGASAQLQAGETWSFQTWFRDPAGGGAGFNLSEGLRLTFQ